MYGRSLIKEVISVVADLNNTFTGANDGYTAKANTTISVVNDELKVEKNSGNHIFGTDKTFTITQNATDYMIDFDITLVSGLGTDVLCKLGNTTVATITSSGIYNNISLGNLSAGQYTLTFVTHQGVGGSSGSKYFTIDNVKVYYEETTPQSIAEYKYGFNGQERDNEVSGKGNSYTAEFWQYDSRLGWRWNIDPVVKPFESSYATFSDNPMLNVDPYGDDAKPVYDKDGCYLGNTESGFTGEPLIFDDPSKFKIGMKDSEAIKHSTTFDKSNLSNSAKSNILTHIVNYKMSDGLNPNVTIKVLSGIDLGRVYNFSAEWATINDVMILAGSYSKYYETSVENIRNVINLHEVKGHVIDNIGTFAYEHHNAQKLQIDHPSFLRTTPNFQGYNMALFYSMSQDAGIDILKNKTYNSMFYNRGGFKKWEYYWKNQKHLE